MSVGNAVEQEERPPFVQFEIRAMEDHIETRSQGKIVYKDVIFALITPPASKDQHEEFAESWIKKQETNAANGRVNPAFVDGWKKMLEAFKNGQEPPVNGFDIRNWPTASKADIRNMISMNVRTVEDLAAINNEGIKRLGMDGQTLKNKANDWLQANKDQTPLVLKCNELENENAVLKASVENLEKQVAFLQSDKSFGADKVDTIPAKEPSSPPASPAERYEQKFGRAPHHRMKEETILAELGE